MFGEDAPAGVGVLIDDLLHILLLLVAAGGGQAVQDDEKHVIADKIVVAILVRFALPHFRAVGYVKMVVKISVAGTPVFLCRVGISHIVIADHRRQGDPIQGQMIQKQTIMLLTPEIRHLIAQVEDKIRLRDIGGEPVQNPIPAVCGQFRDFHIRLSDLSVGGHKEREGVRLLRSLIGIDWGPGGVISYLIPISHAWFQAGGGGFVQIAAGDCGGDLAVRSEIRGFACDGVSPANTSGFIAGGHPVHAELACVGTDLQRQILDLA